MVKVVGVWDIGYWYGCGFRKKESWFRIRDRDSFKDLLLEIYFFYIDGIFVKILYNSFILSIKYLKYEFFGNIVDWSDGIILIIRLFFMW